MSPITVNTMPIDELYDLADEIETLAGGHWQGPHLSREQMKLKLQAIDGMDTDEALAQVSKATARPSEDTCTSLLSVACNVIGLAHGRISEALNTRGEEENTEASGAHSIEEQCLPWSSAVRSVVDTSESSISATIDALVSIAGVIIRIASIGRIDLSLGIVLQIAGLVTTVIDTVTQIIDDRDDTVGTCFDGLIEQCECHCDDTTPTAPGRGLTPMHEWRNLLDGAQGRTYSVLEELVTDLAGLGQHVPLPENPLPSVQLPPVNIPKAATGLLGRTGLGVATLVAETIVGGLVDLCTTEPSPAPAEPTDVPEPPPPPKQPAPAPAEPTDVPEPPPPPKQSAPAPAEPTDVPEPPPPPKQPAPAPAEPTPPPKQQPASVAPADIDEERVTRAGQW